MERLGIDYSLKNIPVPSNNEYKIQLISKVESVIKRMRWKSMEFLGMLDGEKKETYGFKSRKCPPVIKELEKFEGDLRKMVKNVEFRKISIKFQDKLKSDMKEIRNHNDILVCADKSRNIYKLNKDSYCKHLKENITKEYKKSRQDKKKQINSEAQKIAKELQIDD